MSVYLKKTILTALALGAMGMANQAFADSTTTLDDVYVYANYDYGSDYVYGYDPYPEYPESGNSGDGGGGGEDEGGEAYPVINSPPPTDTVNQDGTRVHTDRLGCGDEEVLRQAAVQAGTLQMNTNFPKGKTVTLTMGSNPMQTQMFTRVNTTGSLQFMPAGECK